MIAAAQGLRIWMRGMEVSGLNAGTTFFMHLVPLEYIDPAIYTYLIFAL